MLFGFMTMNENTKVNLGHVHVGWHRVRLPVPLASLMLLMPFIYQNKSMQWLLGEIMLCQLCLSRKLLLIASVSIEVCKLSVWKGNSYTQAVMFAFLRRRSCLSLYDLLILV